MNFSRVDRFNSTLQKNLAEIFLFEINNPVLKTINIIDIHVTKDLKNAHIVFFSLIDEKEVLIQLDKARGYIKKLLAKRMYLKYVPELKFLFNADFEKIKKDL